MEFNQNLVILDKNLIDPFCHDDCDMCLYVKTCNNNHAMPIYCNCCRNPADFISYHLLSKKNYRVKFYINKKTHILDKNTVSICVEIKCSQCNEYYKDSNYFSLMAHCTNYFIFCKILKSSLKRIIDDYLI
jgi:hypothetical protein